MTFDRDMNQTRVKNCSFCLQDFSVGLYSIYRYIFCLFERASQDASPMRLLFLKLLSIKWRKGLTSSFTRKTLKNWCSNYKNALQYNNNKCSFKKPSFTALAVFHALSNQKKYLTLYSTVAECRSKYGKPSQVKKHVQ